MTVEFRFVTGDDPQQIADRLREASRRDRREGALEEFRVKTIPVEGPERQAVCDRSSDRRHGPRPARRATVARMFRRKLPRTSFVLLTISLACAVGAAVVMRAYAVRLDATRPDGGPPSRVVTAADDVTRGTILTDELLEVVTLPARFLPPGAIRDPGRVTGRVAAADLAAGEVLTALRVAGGRAGPTASVVPPGMRAVQVPVASSVGVRPGDVVDVLATFGGGGAHTEVAGEALEVLSIDRGGGASSEAPPRGPTGGSGSCCWSRPPTPSGSRSPRRSPPFRSPSDRPATWCRVRPPSPFPQGSAASIGRPSPAEGPSEHPPGDRPRPRAGGDGVRADLQLGASDPRALDLRVAADRRPGPEEGVRRRAPRGHVVGGADLFPPRRRAVRTRMGPLDPDATPLDARRTGRVGPGDRHDPRRPDRSSVRGRDPGPPGRAAADRGDARRVRGSCSSWSTGWRGPIAPSTRSDRAPGSRWAPPRRSHCSRGYPARA